MVMTTDYVVYRTQPNCYPKGKCQFTPLYNPQTFQVFIPKFIYNDDYDNK